MDAFNSAFFTNILNLGDHVEINGFRMEVTDDGHKRLVIDAVPSSDVIHRCPHCGRNGTYYDTPRSKEGPKEWTSLPVGSTPTVISFKPQRIRCSQCGIVTAEVPWAFHNSGFTKEFDHQVARLALHMNKDAVASFMGISWETVPKAIDRVIANTEGNLADRINNPVHIGIDETSYGHGSDKYLMVVYDHDTKEVIWAEKGRSAETISGFFKQLTEEQRRNIKLVTADGAEWIHGVVNGQCPNAQICLDNFHVFQWFCDAANEVRLNIYNEIMDDIQDLKEQRKELKKSLKGSSADEIKKILEPYDNAIANLEYNADLLKKGKYLLTANPCNLNPEDVEKQKELLAIDPRLRQIFDKLQLFRTITHSDDLNYAKKELKKIIRWAKNCKFKPFNRLANTLANFEEKILNTVQHKLTNGMVESTNNTIKFIIRQGYGFRNITNLIKSIKFRCSKRYLNLSNRVSRRIHRSDWHTCHTYNLVAAS